jgi:type I restriction enzyme M protein
MLTDPKLRSQVDALWDKFWTGGLANPLDAIEQFSYLLFLKRLDDRENAAERQAKRRSAEGDALGLLDKTRSRPGT